MMDDKTSPMSILPPTRSLLFGKDPGVINWSTGPGRVIQIEPDATQIIKQPLDLAPNMDEPEFTKVMTAFVAQGKGQTLAEVYHGLNLGYYETLAAGTTIDAPKPLLAIESPLPHTGQLDLVAIADEAWKGMRREA